MYETFTKYTDSQLALFGLRHHCRCIYGSDNIVILSENRNPVKSLGWVTVLLLLPVVGLILYIFFGRSIKNTRMVSRRTRRKLRRGERRVNADLAYTDLSHARCSR